MVSSRAKDSRDQLSPILPSMPFDVIAPNALIGGVWSTAVVAIAQEDLA